MRPFVLNLLVFALFQAGIFALVWNPALPREGKYIARTIEKHARLKNTAPPRLILVGGSSVAFGFRSEMLETQLNRPVVNMGLAAGLGIEFMLNEVADQIGRGDAVVLSFEYDLFHGGSHFLNIRQLLEMRPASVQFLPGSQWDRFITDFGFHWVGAMARRAVLSPKYQTAYALDAWDYARKDFDYANGFIGHHTKVPTFASQPEDSPLRARVRILPVSDHVMELLTKFADRCHSRGAQCFYTCPPQPPELLTSNLPEIRKNVEALRTIPHLRVIDTPEDHVYALTELQDTQYHLTKNGATRRTEFVIERLRPLLVAE